MRLLSSEKVELVTVLDKTAVIETGVGSGLEDLDVPAIDEITVEAVAGRITHGKHKWLPAILGYPPVKVDGGVDDLVEERDEMYGVGSRAWTIVVRVLSRVSHVGHVVGRVEVDTIPAGWEEDLSTNTVWAGLVGELAVVG